MRYTFISPNNDTLTLTIYHLKENSAFEYEQQPFYCKASIVGQRQIKTYRVQQAVEGVESSVYLKISNLQEEIRLGDKVIFMGEERTVQSIGYFFDESNLTSLGIFNDNYLKARSPKGIALS